MSSRKEQKEQARKAREQKERDIAAAANRQRRLWIIGGVLGIAVLAVLIVVVASSQTGTKSTSADAAAVNEMYADIPQNGPVLGEPDAKATIVEFADLKCPFCADFEIESMPTIIEELIRTGKAKFIYRNLTFLDQASPSGEDSTNAAKYAAASGLQNKLFPFINLFYLNQGEEAVDFVTKDFLLGLAKQVDGLDGEQAWENRENPKVTALIEKAEDMAADLGVTGTPSFFVGSSEKDLRKVSINNLSDPQAILDAVDRLQ